MSKVIEHVRAALLCSKGVTLIGMAFMIIVTGVLIGAISKLYTTWDSYHSISLTDEKMAYVQEALQRYYSENGRYPCPAALTTPIDGAGFGKEVLNDCTSADAAGTFRAQGRDSKMVRTGAVPVRTLNIPDVYMFDGYKHRLFYAVTEEYAVDGAVATGDNGAIFVVDGHKDQHSATSTPGNVVQLVYSMGWDDNGTYSVGGVNIAACDATARSGENCDFADNAVFVNTLAKSANENNLIVSRLVYPTNKTAKPCDKKSALVNTPGDTAFIIDTSGSMGYDETEGAKKDGFVVKCPESMLGCSRIDVARWAMRRVIPARISSNNNTEDPGKTSMTGFVGYDNFYNVDSNLGNIIFDDPKVKDYVAPEGEALNDLLEDKLQTMCPNGSTPLGIHIKSLADRLGDGSKTRPNKITVLSDGISNNGEGSGKQGKFSPLAAAKYIQAKYPNIQVDIVDVVGNPSLMEVSQLTGGSYYRTDNPGVLLNALYSSAGICEVPKVTPPVDKKGCGSKGAW